jgi:hypothetical protein
MADKLYSYASNRRLYSFQGIDLSMFMSNETIGGTSPPL